MLVLSRKKGQQIYIGSDIVVEVVAICGKRVQIGFVAPTEVSIQREEILRRLPNRSNEHPSPSQIGTENANGVSK